MRIGARADIRLDALRANFDLLRNRAPGSRVIAAVKANAYGHGLVAVSRALEDADAFAVARLTEAAQLRTEGIETSLILMAGVITPEELDEADALNCDIVVHSDYQVDLLERAHGARFRVWLKVDTGMHRLGISIRDAPALIERLRDCASVADLCMMTHLANADDTDDTLTPTQFERFVELADGFDGPVSIANSAALLGWPQQLASGPVADANRNWIRPGIALYGVSPLQGRSAAELGLAPVMNFDTELIAVKPLAAGEAVGYGGTWRSQRDTRLGIAAAGYGDGYSRFVPSGAPVLINGRRAEVAGAVSMDLLTIDLGPDAEDAVGDPVRLWGEGLPVEEVAGHAGTTAYQLVTGVRDRSGRLR